MQELSTDSEVTFRRELGSAEILPTRPGVDPLEDTRPKPDLRRISQSPIFIMKSYTRYTEPGSVPGSVPPVASYVFGRRFGQHLTTPPYTPLLYNCIVSSILQLRFASVIDIRTCYIVAQ